MLKKEVATETIKKTKTVKEKKKSKRKRKRQPPAPMISHQEIVDRVNSLYWTRNLTLASISTRLRLPTYRIRKLLVTREQWNDEHQAILSPGQTAPNGSGND